MRPPNGPERGPCLRQARPRLSSNRFFRGCRAGRSDALPPADPDPSRPAERSLSVLARRAPETVLSRSPALERATPPEPRSGHFFRAAAIFRQRQMGFSARSSAAGFSALRPQQFQAGDLITQLSQLSVTILQPVPHFRVEAAGKFDFRGRRFLLRYLPVSNERLPCRQRRPASWDSSDQSGPVFAPPSAGRGSAAESPPPPHALRHGVWAGSDFSKKPPSHDLRRENHPGGDALAGRER